MRLADEFLAACGTVPDLGGFATRMSRTIERAERFEVADDVAKAVQNLMDGRPTQIAAALPLCRLPYDTMWIEWRGQSDRNQRGEILAPIPARQGMLIETPPAAPFRGRVGYMTGGWVHTNETHIPHAVNFSPIAVYFDWRLDGDVRHYIKLAHRTILDACRDRPGFKYLEAFVTMVEDRWCRIPTPDEVSQHFSQMDKWKRYAHSPTEIEAMRFLDRHAQRGVSPHAVDYLALILSRASPAEFEHFMANWLLDIQGEGAFVECFLAMLNSKNPCVEHEPADLSKLNRARRRSGKREFLPYTKTRLALSRKLARIATSRGISREAARQHLVRGHFKVRKTGVYWWSDFERGDPTRGRVVRQSYDVEPE